MLGEAHGSCSRRASSGEVEGELFARVIVIAAKGKLVAEGTMDDLARKRRAAGVVLVVRGDSSAALAAVRSATGIAKAELDGNASEPGVHAIRSAGYRKKKLDEVASVRATESVSALVAAGCFVREVRPVKSSTRRALRQELTRGEGLKG